jgi:DNA/RNA-binding domain of Phe-tRNA-synthetase-like protein
LRSSKITEVPIGIYEFHALHGRNLFLSFQNNSTELRDLQGDIVRNFEDHVLDELNCVDDKLFITKDEDVIISGCKSEGKDININ